MSALLLAGAALAVPDDTDKAAPLGLLVVVILGVVCYFLFRSMSRHLRRVREDFPVDLPTRGAAAPTVEPTQSEPTQPDPAQPTPSPGEV